jgi:hypothetical protein
MDRRSFIATVTASILIAPLVAAAQQSKVYRVGILSPAAVPAPSVGTVLPHPVFLTLSED